MIASCIAACGCVPCGSAASNASPAFCEAASEAASGRVADDTPSHTTATSAGAPSGSTHWPTAKASSLR